jgi:hypothetical protein
MTFCGICIDLYAFRRLQAYVERELNLAKKRKLFLAMRAAVIKAVKARPFKPRGGGGRWPPRLCLSQNARKFKTPEGVFLLLSLPSVIIFTRGGGGKANGILGSCRRSDKQSRLP